MMKIFRFTRGVQEEKEMCRGIDIRIKLLKLL